MLACPPEEGPFIPNNLYNPVLCILPGGIPGFSGGVSFSFASGIAAPLRSGNDA